MKNDWFIVQKFSFVFSMFTFYPYVGSIENHEIKLFILVNNSFKFVSNFKINVGNFWYWYFSSNKLKESLKLIAKEVFKNLLHITSLNKHKIFCAFNNEEKCECESKILLFYGILFLSSYYIFSTYLYAGGGNVLFLITDHYLTRSLLRVPIGASCIVWFNLQPLACLARKRSQTQQNVS